jgi:Holliday junction resolvase RusA-like endonuclease
VIVRLFVPGRPLSTQTGALVGRPKVMLRTVAGLVPIQKGQMFPKRRGGEWVRMVKLHALKHRPPALLQGPMRAEFCYVFEPPPTYGRRELPPMPLHVDAGNLTKGVLDALEGILFENDRWVAEEVSKKRWGRPSGVEITLTSAPEFEI